MKAASTRLALGLIGTFIVGIAAAVVVATRATGQEVATPARPPAALMARFQEDGACVQFVSILIAEPTREEIKAVPGGVGLLRDGGAYVGESTGLRSAFHVADVDVGSDYAWLANDNELTGFARFDVDGASVWVATSRIRKVACAEGSTP